MTRLTDRDFPSRRGKARFLAATPAILHHGGRDFPCDAGDLSRSGVLVQGAVPVPSTPDVEVTLSTGAGDRSVRVAGTVMHAHEDAGEARIGIRFESLTKEQADTIDLLVSRVVEGMAPASLAGIDDKASLGEMRAALSKITPVHRVALAVRGGPSERSILKHDADPHVLEALARNPNTNLPEIKSLLRRSDLLPSTLEIIAADPRWTADEELKILVATHTRVTFQTADRVVAQLNPVALNKVIRRPGLQPGVKQKLMARLSRKHRGGG